MGDKVPFVSVVCLCYNHGQYIRETLDSILMQKTNFAFEIIIHDDASTDNSAEIIMEYYNKYPNIIIPILQYENQYSKNIKISTTYIYPKIRGKYIALCECDDYWIDEFKLQKQIEYLERHDECSACIHLAYKVDAKTKRVLNQIVISCTDRDFGVEETIEGLGSRVATNSIVYRAKYIQNISMFYKKLSNTGVGDYLILVFLSIFGKIHYINEFMSVYRSNVKDSWTDRMNKSICKYLKYLNNHILMLHELFEIVPKEYHTVLEQEIVREKFELLAFQGKLFTIKRNYPLLYDDLTLNKKLKIILHYLLLKIDNKGIVYDNVRKIYNYFRCKIYG